MRKTVCGVVMAVAIALITRGAYAENQWIWPRPADQPGIAVPCSQCPPETLNKLTPPYSDPLRFVGRFDNASFVSTRQQPFRTAFSFKVYVDKAHNRLYYKLGSAVSVYDANAFITRLQAREPLMRISELPGLGYMDSMLIESFLRWDKWFYAEFTNMSQWWTVVVDGEDRLSSIDFDDRGNVYIATSQFGWGILQDDGKRDAGFMPSQYQSPQRPPTGDETAPTTTVVVKSNNGRYYAFVGGSMTVMNIWDVTNVKNPVRKGDFPHTFTVASRTADRVAFKGEDGKIYIYSADGMVSGQGPLTVVTPPTYGLFLNAVNDGTNFYVMTKQADRTLAITKLVPDSGRTNYSQAAVFQTGKSGSPRSLMAYDGGYLAFVYQDDSVGVDGAMFRMTDSGLTEIPLHNFIGNYYLGTANSPYVAPRSFPNEIVPLVLSGKVYLLVNSTNLGDVYEIKTNDSVSLTANQSLAVAGVPAKRGTANTNAPAAASGTVYYGDTARFGATTSASGTQTLQWDFGNSTAAVGADPNTTTTLTVANTTGQISVADHQFSGVNRTTACSALPCAISPFAVSVGGAAPSTIQTTSIQYTLTPPQARVGVTNGTTTYKYIDTKYLLALPNASAPAPIVAGDFFFDGSDGEAEGHFAQWDLVDGASNRQLKTVPYSPADASLYRVPVGGCGAHSLTFGAHYGPYTSSFLTLAGAAGEGSNYIETVGPFNYNVQAFAAAIDSNHAPNSAGNPVFHSLARASTPDAGALTAAQVAALKWQWDLVASNSDTVVAAGPTGAGLPVSDWEVSKSLITSPGLRVRLAIISPTDPAGGCAGSPDPLFGNQRTSKAYSNPLNPPDPVLGGSCTGGPCHFNITSASNVDMTADRWHYSWSSSPASNNSPLDQATFDPVFSQTGTYQVTIACTITNDVGSKPVSTTFSYTNTATCPPMTVNNVYPALDSSCPGGTCPTNTALSFSVQSFGYSFACANHTFSWDFGDGTSPVSAGSTTTHSYSTAGPYQVKVTIANSTQTFTTSSITINVGGGVTPTQCPTMTVNNVYLTNLSSSSCPGGTCPTNTAMTFEVTTFGYSFACASHTFMWNFGDGTPTVSGGSQMQHSFANGGTFSISVTISNSSQSNFAVAPVSVTVGGGVTPTQCPPMTVNNVYLTNDSLGLCPGGVCPASTPLTLSVATFGYSFACASHTFNWTFGDGTQTSTSASSVQHSFPASSTAYSVSVTISNSGQSFTPPAMSVQVGSNVSSCPTMNVNNVYLGLLSACPNSVCPPEQPVSFAVQTFGYSLVCSSHTYTWDFGDGSAPVEGTSTASHTFSGRNDPYLVKVTLKNTGQTFTTAPLPITVKPNGVPATSATKVSVTPLALSTVGAYRFTPGVDPQGVGINFHWEVRVGATVIESADKVGLTPFEPVTRFLVGNTYVVSVTVDGGPSATVSITQAPPRRRASRR